MSRWLNRLPGSRFLELFAGSGAVVLEALSRGAGSGWAIDRSLQTLRENLSVLELACETYQGKLPAALEKLPAQWPEQFDLIFVDPPYGYEETVTVLKACTGLLCAEGELALEQSQHDEAPARVDGAHPGDGSLKAQLVLTEERRYGDSVLRFYAVEDESS